MKPYKLKHETVEKALSFLAYPITAKEFSLLMWTDNKVSSRQAARFLKRLEKEGYVKSHECADVLYYAAGNYADGINTFAAIRAMKDERKKVAYEKRKFLREHATQQSVHPTSWTRRSKMKHPFYPFLLSLFPVSLLLAGNLAQLSAWRIVHPAAGMLLLTVALMAIGWRLWRDWNLAAWAACLALAVLNYQTLPWLVIPGAVALVFWKAPIQKKNVYFNIAALALLAIPLGYIVFRSVRRGDPAGRPYNVGDARPKITMQNAARPDIYFILLDSYTSHAVLRDRFGYDNFAFLQALRAQGFNTGDCSSQYDTTEASLASTLNRGAVAADLWGLWPQLQHSQVRTRLAELHYPLVAFQSGFDWSEIRDADWFVRDPLFSLNDFDLYYLTQTLPGRIPAFRRVLMAAWSENYRLRLQGSLDMLPTVAGLPWQKFVFVHLLMPHPPFVFHADGSRAGGYALRNPAWDATDDDPPEYTPGVYAAGYVDQVAWLDRVLPGVLLDIRKYSTYDPIIIIQGDHGAWYTHSAERMAILCAVHNPTGWSVPLEPEETFEFVFDER